MKVNLKHFSGVIALWLGLSCSLWAQDGSQIRVQDLPPEARQTLQLIKQGGPFPYDKDGAVFGNYERLLPKHQRGYYREYTVKTPYARNRGAKRIIAGGERRNFSEFYYTVDHYASFKRIRE